MFKITFYFATMYYSITDSQELTKLKDRLIGLPFHEIGMEQLFINNREIVGHVDYSYFICQEIRKNRLGLSIPFHGVIDKHGNMIVPFEYGVIQHFHDNIFKINRFIQENHTRKWGIIKCDGEIICPIEYDFIGRVKEGVFAIVKDNKLGFMDLTGNLRIPVIYDAEDLNNKVLPARYEFNDGYVCVCIDGKFGFIDHYNNSLTDFIFEHYCEFQNGVAKVCIYKQTFTCKQSDSYALDLEGNMKYIDGWIDEFEQEPIVPIDDLDAYEGNSLNIWNTD